MSECVYPCLSYQLAKLISSASYYIVTCGLSVCLYHEILHYLINVTIFGGKKYKEYEICVLVFFTNVLCNISQSEKCLARYHKGTLVFM